VARDAANTYVKTIIVAQLLLHYTKAVSFKGVYVFRLDTCFENHLQPPQSTLYSQNVGVYSSKRTTWVVGQSMLNIT
jgi:hypothetical protein